MFHRHSYKLFGIYYEISSSTTRNYVVTVYEVYKCARCNKYKREKKVATGFTFSSNMNEYVESLKKLGYKEYIELYKDKLVRGE